jgi:rod shape determining protein RodA
MPNFKKNFDYSALGLYILLVLIGILCIYSASTTKVGDQITTNNFFLKQLLFFGVSFGVLVCLIYIPLPIIEAFYLPGYVFSVILLILVLFMPVINGSHRWFPLGGLSFQPSELAKLTMILIVSKAISKPHMQEIEILWKGLVLTLIPISLILIEPDFGTTIVYWIILLGMYAAAGIPFVYLLMIISPILSVIFAFNNIIYVLFVLFMIVFIHKKGIMWPINALLNIINLMIFFLIPVIWNGFKPYQQNRILTFINPNHDPLGTGYQVIQAKIAIGSGGLYGKGFLLGTQKNMDFLPEKHTDFIFSVIGEEFGFWGAGLLILLYLVFLTKLIKNIDKIFVKDRKIAAVGIISYLAFQFFVNIAMNIGIMPTTGVPLPFISYGGSNLLINTIAIGLILKYRLEKGLLK